MKTIENILRSGLAKTGNGFKITLEELVKVYGMEEVEVIRALNGITKYKNAWDMIIN